MLTEQRIFHDDNGTLRDLSASMNSLTSGNAALALVASQDKLYIGADAPFNHRYFQMAVVNDQASVASVEIWDGSAWRAAVNVVDETAVSGASLGQSGILSWTPNRHYGWGLEDTTEDIPALASLKIYGLYWVRITWSADLKATTSIAYCGHKFATDADLETQYPDLAKSATKTAFKAGKTDWNDQHVVAAEAIIRDLKNRQIVWSRNQVLGWEMFNAAAVHKVAEIIMRGFGDDWSDERQAAREAYD